MKGKNIENKAPEMRLCAECGKKPTITEKSPYCASCMARRANDKKRLQKAQTRTSGSDISINTSRQPLNIIVRIDFSVVTAL